jgi:hypothetical protein
MQFGLHLVRQGLITPADFVEVVEHQMSQRPLFGALAIELRRLSLHQVFEILGVQAESSKQFGRVAVDLLYLTEAEVMELLGRQSDRCQPIDRIVVELGVLDQPTVDRELRSFRRIMSQEPQEAGISTTTRARRRKPDAATPCGDSSDNSRSTTSRNPKSKAAKAAAATATRSAKARKK